MKLSEQWLREWVNPPISQQELAQQLTMAGLEVEQTLETSLELSITPNRGDCLSIAGIAREVAVKNRMPLTLPPDVTSPASITDTLPISIKASADCPHYVGRIIRNINPAAQTPAWMKERLINCGIEPILPVVDIMNYVMMELGQPLHAFDLSKIQGEICVRKALAGEKLILLDSQEIKLRDDMLVIADKKHVLALAGIMGGLDSAITNTSTDIFLESAFFNPLAIVGRARHYGLQTDAAFRFERGVDPALQVKAIERASVLLLEIVGGAAGPVSIQKSTEHMPILPTIQLRKERIQQLIGIPIPDAEAILIALGMNVTANKTGWQVIPPSYRSDITIEADLIEELVRIYGYDHVPARSLQTQQIPHMQPEEQITLGRLRKVLVDRGYQEVITYSFVDPKIQQLIFPDAKALALTNPISPELSVMRTSLWPGLLSMLRYNQNRQQSRIRLFESGLRFIQEGATLKQEAVLSGVVTGSVYKEQWGTAHRPGDFYDVKNDLEALFALTGDEKNFSFVPCINTALHPGQACNIMHEQRHVGLLGKLHPSLKQALELDQESFLFELILSEITVAKIPSYAAIPKFPSMRRDIAILIDRIISAEQVKNEIFCAKIDWLQEVFVFDVYQGKGIDPDKKSMALGLVFQTPARTLQDSEINTQVAQVIQTLENKLQAVLRT